MQVELSHCLMVVSGYGKNLLIISANMSSSVHVDDKKKDILIFGKDLSQE